MTKVCVMMSGGVDSSVAAGLLLRQGYEVEGVFMKNWSPESLQALTDCPWEQDQEDARAACEKLGIAFRSINFEQEYRDRVVKYFLNEYQRGRTPNPDVMCNKEIKFDVFLQAALASGADMVATGHYVKKLNGALYRGQDPKKDQSYFLYAIGKLPVEKSIFPLGDLLKTEVRNLALEMDLPNATKKDSQGICFIGHIELREFLKEALSEEDGETYLLPVFREGVSFTSRVEGSMLVGKHRGSKFYTLGQRAGDAIDNRRYKILRSKEVKPVYVIHKIDNILYLTDDFSDPDFKVKEIILENWYTTGSDEIILPDPDQKVLLGQVRYQQKEMNKITSIKLVGEEILINIEDAVAVAPGQSLVVYDESGRMWGGGVIKSTDKYLQI